MNSEKNEIKTYQQIDNCMTLAKTIGITILLDNDMNIFDLYYGNGPKHLCSLTSADDVEVFLSGVAAANAMGIRNNLKEE